MDLLIVHPTLDPSEITAALGLQAHRQQRVGAPRVTPKGTPLPGNYKDSRWRHSIRYDVKEQWFVDRVALLVDRLTAYKVFLADLKSTGGQATIIVKFLGDGYFGDAFPAQTLADMAELGLDLGIECFSIPQSGRSIAELNG